MSASKRCRQNGFTIIELLIVIAIIAVLATAGLGVAYMLLERAKRMSAFAVCTELVQGIDAYYEDHSQLPIELTEDATINSNSSEGLAMLRVLLDEETSDSKLNTSGRSYLNIKQGRNGVDGLIYNDALVLEGLVDPWGGDYQIRLDGGLDKEVEVQPKGAASPKRLKRRAAAWSNGRDGVDATGDSKDDVTTW